MEICPVSGRFPAIPFRFSQSLTDFSTQSRRMSPFCLKVPSNIFRSDADSGQLESRMFILGMGFVGQFFAKELQRQRWVVSGTCTSIGKKKKLEEMGFDVYVFNANEPDPEVLNILNYHTHVLVSIPPVVGIGDLMLRHEELLKNILTGGNLQWLCYLSSTSVYGDRGGEWVDEDYPITPASELAKARLVAEEGWLNLGCDLRLSTQIFRLGGIYGPGRSAIDTIIKQEPSSEVQKMRSSKRYTSRVHVADISQALNAAVHKPSLGKIYNIVDDDPSPRTEVFMFARNLIEKKWPGQIKQARSLDRVESLMPKGSSRDGKRVSNARMKRELEVRLLHPDYRSGLQSIVEHIDDSFLYNPPS
ncbi:unnamed protein product [Ilex paraguariensis]|uniref:NAD-dependent epimerase/dehydratase domain-containing protein n=1 Tax=Ilex paraguariensis TaxID=185542 RepID=A0ABC8SVJ6_9AQUA